MSLFKSGKEKELDTIIAKLEANVSNNYKDAAQENFREFGRLLNELKESEGVKPKKISYYQTIFDGYDARLKEFTHKDQKPYWT